MVELFLVEAVPKEICLESDTAIISGFDPVMDNESLRFVLAATRNTHLRHRKFAQQNKHVREVHRYDLNRVSQRVIEAAPGRIATGWRFMVRSVSGVYRIH